MRDLENGKRYARAVIEQVKRDYDTESWRGDDVAKWADAIEDALECSADDNAKDIIDMGAYIFDAYSYDDRDDNTILVDLVTYGVPYTLASVIAAAASIGEEDWLLDSLLA